MAALPAEVLLSIFQQVRLPQRGWLRSVCRQWDSVIMHGRPHDPIRFEYTKGEVISRVLSQRRNVFITGPGGSGKTALLNSLHSAATRRNRKLVMLAPTQMAAEHIPMGRTIHSFLHIKKTLTDAQIDELQQKRKKYYIEQGVDIIVVDECSMMGTQLMSCMNRLLQWAWGSTALFGGAQLVLCGDMYQLPPVCDRFCFRSPLWQQLQLVSFELTVPLRHGEDLRWYRLLQDIRCGTVRTLEEAGVISRICQDVPSLLKTLPTRPVFLCSDNLVVEEINVRELDTLKTPLEKTLPAADNFFRLETVDGHPQRLPCPAPRNVQLDRFWRCPQQLPLKVGARYICTQNINKERGVINGRGCTYLGDDEFLLDNGHLVQLYELYANFCYNLGNHVILVRHQVALRLGYAITNHKAQGMTLDKVICDLRTVRSVGSVYVALSRVRCMEDLYLANAAPGQSVPVSREVMQFYQSYQGYSLQG